MIQERRHQVGRNDHLETRQLLLRQLDANRPHTVNFEGLWRFDLTGALTMRAGRVRDQSVIWATTLTRQFDQTKLRHRRNKRPCWVGCQLLANRQLDQSLVITRFHVDEVDNDQPTDVAQQQLLSNNGSRFKLVFNAVAATSLPSRLFDELTSIANNASVCSITILPPDGK